MAEEKNVRNDLTDQLSVRVYASLPEKLRATVPQGFKLGHCVSAAVKLWIDLPDEIRIQLLTGQFEDSLVEIVQQIVDRRIEEDRAAAEKLLEPHSKKRGPKG